MKRVWLIVAFVGASCSTAKQEPPAKLAVEFFKVDPAKAGTVVGAVHFKGKPL